jgi:hypothetical protein
MSGRRKKRPQTNDTEDTSARAETKKTRTDEDKATGEELEDAGAYDLPIRILPLWAWGIVIIVSFLIAFWLVSTYVLGTP